MAEAPNQTRIFNAALARVGSTERAVSIDDTSSVSARRARLVWDDLRRALLMRHPFNFAVQRFMLNEAATKPTFGWQRQYALPPCLRWLPPRIEDADYFDGEREGEYILTNRVAPLPVRCIVDIEDVTKWSASFVMAMEIALTEVLALPVTQSAALTQAMGEIADRAIREAKRIDGLETGSRHRQPARVESRWLRARNRATYDGY